MKKPTSIFFGLAVCTILAFSACSEGELLDPQNPDLEGELTSQENTTTTRTDKALVGVEVSSEELSSIASLSSDDQTLSSDALSSDAVSSVAVSSVAQSSIAQSSVAQSSVAQSSIATSSVATSSAASSIAVSSAASSSSQAGGTGTCDNPTPWVAGNYPTTEIVEFSGVKYTCAPVPHFCNVPQGHTPVSYGWSATCN